MTHPLDSVSVWPRRPAAGSALIIVLAFMVLIVSLAVMFLVMVGDETVVSASYSQAVAQQKLNESAVNLAIAQINSRISNGF